MKKIIGWILVSPVLIFTLYGLYVIFSSIPLYIFMGIICLSIILVYGLWLLMDD